MKNYSKLYSLESAYNLFGINFFLFRLVFFIGIPADSLY